MYLSLLSFLIFFKYTFTEYSEYPSDTPELYSGSWMVRITKGPDVAKRIAQNEGFIDIDEISEMKLYRFSNLITQKQNHHYIYARLSKYEEISWIKAEKIKEEKHAQIPIIIRHPFPGINFDELFPGSSFTTVPKITSRYYDDENPELEGMSRIYCAGPENIVLKTNMPSLYNDPLYTEQWFMRSCQEVYHHIPSYYDIKLTQTREDFKLYGEGVRIVVMDDAITVHHEDLVIDLDYSYNYYTKQADPSPMKISETHGTMCAGVIGMTENNKICGVGIAPRATIGGLKVFKDNSVTDWIYANAFQFKASDVDIISRSLGRGEGHAFDPIEEEVHSALQIGVTKGRRGKGIIYVFSSANDKQQGHTCSTRAFENSIFSITIGGVNHDGKASNYAERCAAVMAVVYSGNGYPYSIPTLDSTSNIGCTGQFNGTSASTPLAAGLFSLVLQANPKLTWRELQHIIAWTSEMAAMAKNPGWVENGAGFYVNLDFGFGLLNVYDMVEMAMNFEPIGPMHSCTFDHNFGRNGSTIDLATPKRIRLSTDGCKGLPTEVRYIEHVELTIFMRYAVRGDLQIDLTSPKKTKVHILEQRPHDETPFPILSYSFQSVHTWGEDPQGEWFIDFFDENGDEKKLAEIRSVAITLHGTKEQPSHYKNGKRKYLAFSAD